MAWFTSFMPSLRSSCIAWVDYNLGTLRIQFRNGSVYTFLDVPEIHYLGLLNASSPGRYFNTYLKGRY